MDILLLILLAVGFVMGLISGAIKQIISLAALVLGFVIACLYYQQLGEVLSGFLSMPTLCRVVAFILLWVIVPILARLISALLTSVLDSIMGLGLLNRLLGGILGLAKYALVLGAIISFLSSMKLIPEETMQTSRLAKPLKALPEYLYHTFKASPSAGGLEGTANE